MAEVKRSSHFGQFCPSGKGQDPKYSIEETGNHSDLTKEISRNHIAYIYIGGALDI
mgnify:CR=1 FL=1